VTRSLSIDARAVLVRARRGVSTEKTVALPMASSEFVVRRAPNKDLLQTGSASRGSLRPARSGRHRLAPGRAGRPVGGVTGRFEELSAGGPGSRSPNR
jgi:hypothetical protein